MKLRHILPLMHALCLLLLKVSSIQYDFLEEDDDPFPEDYVGNREGHGTSVAGEVAMEKGNDVCGVGVAYNSFITG